MRSPFHHLSFRGRLILCFRGPHKLSRQLNTVFLPRVVSKRRAEERKPTITGGSSLHTGPPDENIVASCQRGRRIPVVTPPSAAWGRADVICKPQHFLPPLRRRIAAATGEGGGGVRRPHPNRGFSSVAGLVVGQTWPAVVASKDTPEPE